MIDQEKVKRLYTKKVEKLLKLNKAYFEKDSPIVSDSEFDELKKDIEKSLHKLDLFQT